MLYQKEIEDYVLIQYIILYTLSGADSDVVYNELLSLVLDNCNINYADFQVALDNLVKTDHVRTRIEAPHKQKYSITEKGMNAVEFFSSSIPIYIREPIDDSIKQMYIEERRRNAVESGVSLVRNDEYNADCVLRDDDRTELMRLTLYAGSRDEAERLAKLFRVRSAEIYGKILDAFSGEKERGEEQE